MSIEGKKILAIVPARGGSKGIPRKNLKCLNGSSLVNLAAKSLSGVDFIDKKIISTEDNEIACEGLRSGLEVPFMRPHYLSSDTAKSVDVWLDAWEKAEMYYKMIFDISVLIEPTSPCRISDDIIKTVNVLIKNRGNAAFTISKTPGHYTPQKTLVLNEKGYISFYIGKEGENFSLRQKIPQYYHRNGICYAVTRDHLFNKGSIIEGALAIIIDRVTVNIDNDFDLMLAEYLLSLP